MKYHDAENTNESKNYRSQFGNDDLLTVEQACRWLHWDAENMLSAVKPYTLRKAIEKEELIARRYGRTTLISVSDLKEYDKACRVPGKAHISSCMDPTTGLAQSGKSASNAISGMSSGAKVAPSVNTQRAMSAARMLTRKPTSESSSGNGNQGTPAPAVPIR